MTIEIDIQLNRLAQRLEPLESGLRWLESMPLADRKSVILRLANLVVQASPRDTDCAQAIEASTLKPSYTPCVLLSRGWVNVDKLSRLGGVDQSRSFVLLLTLLSLADSRRKQSEATAECTHWWHRDLSDPAVLDEIRRNEAGAVSGPSVNLSRGKK